MTEDTPTRLAAIQRRLKECHAWHKTIRNYTDAEDLSWLLTELARLQAERDELRNAIAGCGEHTPNVSHAYMVALATDNAEAEEALNGDAGAKVQLEAAEAARDEAQRELTVWRTSPENLAEQFKAQRDEAQRQTAALRAALEQIRREIELAQYEDLNRNTIIYLVAEGLAAGTETL